MARCAPVVPVLPPVAVAVVAVLLLAPPAPGRAEPFGGPPLRPPAARPLPFLGESCPPGEVVVGITADGHLACAVPPCVPCPGASPCGQPRDAGPCTAVIPRWHFDTASGQCLEFTYGGCGGNANNFETQAECMAACGPSPCSLPIDAGPCDAVVPRWAFDVSSGQCVAFTYGGCGGNANNFETEAECEAACE